MICDTERFEGDVVASLDGPLSDYVREVLSEPYSPHSDRSQWAYLGTRRCSVGYGLIVSSPRVAVLAGLGHLGSRFLDGTLTYEEEADENSLHYTLERQETWTWAELDTGEVLLIAALDGARRY